MSIRLPILEVLDETHTNLGATSVAGGWAYPFNLPTDVDNVVVKVNPSTTAGGVSVIFQTSDDGGTTFYDVARTSIASNSGATAVTGANAQWLSIPVISPGMATARTFAAASIITGGIGSTSASTLASGQISGLPIIGIRNRLFLISDGNVTAHSTRIQVRCNSKSAQ